MGRHRVLRILLVAMGVPNLVAGLWAVLAPRSWFDDFPGWAPRLVAALPPFNEHLATDAGAGLLATGVGAVVAAWLLRRDVVLTAAGVYLVFAGPHALWHLTHPADALTGAENALNAGFLVLAASAAVAVLVLALGLPDREPTATSPGSSGRLRSARGR